MTKTVDYVTAIEQAKNEAKMKEKTYIDMIAGELHKEVNDGKYPTLPSCCAAMKKCMLENDEILVDPKTKSGFSNKLTIRYYVNDLQSRKQLFPDKQRGRKKGTSVPKNNKLKSQKQIIEDWLNEYHLGYIFDGKYNSFTVFGENGLWLIQTHYEKSFDEDFMSMLYQKTDEIEKCSIFTDVKKDTLQKWKLLSKTTREKLNFTLITLGNKGKINELK